MYIKKIFILLIITLTLFSIKVNAFNKSVVDITKMNISEISEALNSKLITSEELVKLYLDRIEAYDKDFSAIISINKEALEEAKILDKLRSEGKIKSVMHGIPIIVKDNIDVLGLPTTAGSKSLKDNYPKSNSFAVQKLIDAGVIILAKANMSEFAFEASSSRSSFGTVKNAYNLDYSSYGSSGGSAVAVAASYAVAALGTDTNSSIRLPAAAANIIGFRPTVGLISRRGVLPYDPERDTIGTLTKTVADSILIVNIINGYDKQDSKTIKQEQKKYISNSSNLKEITIGISNDFFRGSASNNLPENQETYLEIQALMETAIEKLEKEKVKIVYLDEYYTFKTDYWFLSSLNGYLFCDSFNEYIKNTTGSIRNFTQLFESSGKITSLDYYIDSCNSSLEKLAEKNILKNEYKNYIEKIMADNNLDVIMYPTTKNKLLKSNDYSKTQNLSAHASSTINYPTITLPLGFDKENLSYGLEFMVKTGEEQLLYDVATVYEKINGNQNYSLLTPSLYKIPKNIQELVINYTETFKKTKKYYFEKKWLKKSQNFFRNYFKNNNIKMAKTLNNQYFFLKSIILIIKLLIVIAVSLIIRLFIRKKVIKNTKFHKKRRKKHK